MTYLEHKLHRTARHLGHNVVEDGNEFRIFTSRSPTDEVKGLLGQVKELSTLSCKVYESGHVLRDEQVQSQIHKYIGAGVLCIDQSLKAKASA